MTARQIAKLRSETLASDGFRTRLRNSLTKAFIQRLHPEHLENLEQFSHYVQKRMVMKLSKQVTIGEVMDLIDTEDNKDTNSLVFNKWDRQMFFKRLIGHGMHHLNWKELHPSTVTHLLPKLKKGAVLRLSLIALGTLSNKALAAVESILCARERDSTAVKRDLWGATVEDLITGVTFDTLTDRREGRDFSQSFFLTKEKLEALGFGYDDGMFFRIGTKRELADRLAMRHSVGSRTAKHIVRIARAEGWIKLPLEAD